MSDHEFRKSESPEPAGQDEAGKRAFARNPANIKAALSYLDEVEPKWILDPESVDVDQPANQESLIGNLRSMLDSQEGGDDHMLSKMLNRNLDVLSLQAESSAGFARLDIRLGYEMRELDTSGLSKAEYSSLFRNSSSIEEFIDDVDQPNIMLTGLLHATGAKVLRDDIADGNPTGQRVYKGMLEDSPVYFVEIISPRAIKEDGKTTTVLSRAVFTEPKGGIEFALKRLSDADVDILRSVGIEVPPVGATDYDPNTYPNRPRMAETLRLYHAVNGPEGPDQAGEPGA